MWRSLQKQSLEGRVWKMLLLNFCSWISRCTIHKNNELGLQTKRLCEPSLDHVFMRGSQC